MELLIIGIILLVILVRYLQSPESRGLRGENKVRCVIGQTVEDKQYVINDLILSSEGMSTQIDHIVINPRGIFVIETKNYSGEIYGAELQREWTQVLAGGNVVNQLYNPLKQNATHVYKVKQIVGKLPVHSLVVFVQNNTQNIKANNVIPLSSLRSFLQCGEGVLSCTQMKTAYEALSASRAEITKREHVHNVKQQQRNLERGICPRCGGKLTLRNGEYGEFWGCSNYPKCRFIKKD